MKQLALKLLCYTRQLIDLFTNFIFGFIHGRSPGRNVLPDVCDLILLESAVALAKKIRLRKISSVEVVESYINRICDINPVLNCCVDRRFEEALQDAKLADEFISNNLHRVEDLEIEKPFLGVPFTVKVSLPVKGLIHTAGLCARKDIKADFNAPVVENLIKAGAIPVAVSNVSEFCMWWESYNNVHGRTYNPYDLSRIAGGSSGGEACLQSSAGSPMGIGSDIAGSIRVPAFFNGIFGHKPTSGVVSNEGQIPVPHGDLDNYLCTGPLSRFACDLAPMLKVMACRNEELLKLEEKVDISKLNLYYMESDGGGLFVTPVQQDIKKSLHQVIKHLQQAHGVKAKQIRLSNMKYAMFFWVAKILEVESPQLCERLNEKGKVNMPLELVKWLLWMSRFTLPTIAIGLGERLIPGIQSEFFQNLLIAYKDLKLELDTLLGNNGVLLYPPHPTVAPYHHQPLFMPFNIAYSVLFNILGYPVTQCPLGLNADGLPLGIQIVSAKYNDRYCLAVASELEKAFGGWVCPTSVL